MNDNLRRMRKFTKPIWTIVITIVALGFFINLSSTMIPNYYSDYKERLTQVPYQMSVSLKDEFRTKQGGDIFVCVVSHSPIKRSDVLQKAPLGTRFSNEQIEHQIKIEDGCKESVDYSYFIIR